MQNKIVSFADAILMLSTYFYSMIKGEAMLVKQFGIENAEFKNIHGGLFP